MVGLSFGCTSGKWIEEHNWNDYERITFSRLCSDDRRFACYIAGTGSAAAPVLAARIARL
jgi:hypothetical protein